MFLIDWFYNLLANLGLWRKEAKILFLGLDNAGKTTLLRFLKDARLVQHEPTRHPTSEDLTIGRVRFKAFDLGGHQISRKLWRDYYTQVDGIVYLVDSADENRFPESRKELDAIIMDESIQSVPILILGNKIDLPKAVSKEKFKHELGLSCAGNSVRPIGIFMCSVVCNMGYDKGIEWLSQNI